ncbi:MAG TPA: endonuclease Q family protein [Candidatus Pacearchaeota archaeon]|nr:endonuclease Q family protein [Candidatus Pacearchaeota archaeon]HRR94618.1 endonuclease Q family protein [Candidatus Paceibacterota bacterium]HPC30324.1 endonuclease Q family protein [Candidatus Pacearchaeota archaeon]HQG09014.1 endonuclease Q family protein [Candidatus Pacearchaeota archaeon]HQH19995.1 endonuclease Q family protein [Candidatus Pacearchaeota archaeon]
MKFIADFHLHSKYSRATGKNTDLENIDKWAKTKGIQVITCGDFTHPIWFKNLEEKLELAEPGLFKLKGSKTGVRFILTTEISCIYSKKGKIRKIHILVFAPSLKIVEKLNQRLAAIGNISSDGRPILGIDAIELLKIVLDVSPDCLFVPAHCLTPWFSIFGSKSGFDSIKECFEDYSQYIYAIESGLSADPAMIWRIPDGRRVTIISNSDAHSVEKIGREANIFNTEINYFSIINAIKTKNPKEFLSTIEFYPQEGKYYNDGDRLCNISLNPKESLEYGELCPSCGKKLVIGVLNRVQKLADKEEGFKPDNITPFQNIVPLKEIIAEAYGVGVISKKVQNEYEKITANFPEFEVLLNVSLDDLKNIADKQVIEGIKRVRNGEVKIQPGFDGVFGKVKIFSDIEKQESIRQGRLL